MEENERYERAKRRVKELKSFYVHLATYVAVMVLLFFIDYLDKGNWWFYWPLLGWGIAVAMHALGTFSSGWERRKIRQLMERDKGDKP